MKKKSLLLLVMLFVLVFAGCGKQSGSRPKTASELPSQEKEQKPEPDTYEMTGQTADSDLEAWQNYANPKHGYTISYPAEWFYLEDACCPPPPTFANFNNISVKREELAKAQVTEGAGSLDILCLYEADLDQIGEVRSYKEEEVDNEPVKINGFPGIKITTPSAPDSDTNIITYYLSNPSMESCRITFQSGCEQCEQILRSFTYSK